MFIDTHSHCYSPSMAETKSNWIKNLALQRVQKVLLPNIDVESIPQMLDLVSEDPNLFVPMMGIHPCSIQSDYLDVLSIAQNTLEKNPNSFCAIGEIGLDYYWDTTFQSQQIEAFHMQIEWALAYDKPIAVHSRKSNNDAIEIIKQYAPKGLQGVFHCFSGSYEEAIQLIDAGFYLGIGGVVTYPKAGLAEVVQKIDLKHIVLETDAPYLPPVPHRGKQNESSYVAIVAQKIAELKRCEIDEVASITTSNAIKLFNLN
jgi:TatD DNase family protein